MRLIITLAACVLLPAGSMAATPAVLFQFWPGKGAERAPGFVETHGHPCGEVALAKVSKLPTAKNGPLQSDLVVELNAGGKVIRRWPMPVDFLPRAVRGNELLVSIADEGYWVRPDGSFKKAEALPAIGDRQPFKCDLTRVFGKSDFAMCETLVDLVSHKKRTFGHQGVCT
jgi:hypothetical protein